MSPESLPVKLRQLRGAMSLAEAAERSQIPEQRIRMYEEGVRQPYNKTLKRLADAYGVSVSELGNGVAAAPTASAPPAQAARRRRRRRRAASPDGERTVEVPVEVRPGERVRIVIELIVRPATDQPAETERAAATVALRAEPAAEDPLSRATSRPAPPQPTAPPAPATRPLHAAASPGLAHQRRPQQARTADGKGHAGSPDLRDPLAEFRRAYGEFRRTRKP